MAAPLQPGDTLILINENGGRIAIVHEVDEQGDIIEKHGIPGQQKYVDARRRDRFVRPKNAIQAHIALGRLKQIAEERDAEIAAAKAKANKAFRSVYSEYEIDFDEVEHRA